MQRETNLGGASPTSHVDGEKLGRAIGSEAGMKYGQIVGSGAMFLLSSVSMLCLSSLSKNYLGGGVVPVGVVSVCTGLGGLFGGFLLESKAKAPYASLGGSLADSGKSDSEIISSCKASADSVVDFTQLLLGSGSDVHDH